MQDESACNSTGEIVEVFPYNKDGFAYIHEDGETVYEAIELEVDECDPDYWTRLEHQYAGMAMQGIMTNPIGFENIRVRGTNIQIETALLASEFAHALVEQLKEKEERK